MAEAKTSASVLFAHGTRDAQWAKPFRALRTAVSGRRPDVAVELAHLEMMKPPLGKCGTRLADAGHRRIAIAPLFLAQGGHLRQDLPRLLEELESKHPAVEIKVRPPIGEVTVLLDAIAGWLVSSAPR